MADIIATIGPSSGSCQRMKEMAGAGMTIARINTKHANKAKCLNYFACLRKAGVKVLFDIKSLEALGWVKDLDYDYLAVSFAETATQIKRVRALARKGAKIIAKIETQRGINNVDSLIKASDGIMVARGDLGRNIPLERVPIVQKIITRKCNRARRMSITATEMLLSMTKSRVPERSEVSDVANAVLDGSDALMLSEETAIGRYPVLTVATMKKIITETQRLRRFV